MSTFDLAPLTLRAHGNLEAITFTDFIVDGAPLHDVVTTSSEVGVLSTEWDSRDFARQLAMEEPGDPNLKGRVQVYGCRSCLDLYCGGYAVEITRVGDRVRWGSFERFSFDYDTESWSLRPTRFGPYEFKREQYLTALKRFLHGGKK